MKPYPATLELMMLVSFLAGATRAWKAAHEYGLERSGGLLGIARGRSFAARSCYRSWLYHSRKLGCFAEEVLA